MKTPQRTGLIAAALAASLTACDWMDMTFEPQTILTDDQVWGEPSLIEGVLADYYDRLPVHGGLEDNGELSRPTTPAYYDDAIFSGSTREGPNQVLEYGFDWWTDAPGPGTHWDQQYDLIRDIHVAMTGITETESNLLTDALKEEYLAELRFLRAFLYFELVKRMGGVPLVTEQLIYDFGGDPSSLQLPRAAEAEVYDFIGSELDATMGQLGNQGSLTRAHRYTALALKSRAMLYAGSIARHNSEMASPITLPGGEVGIPEERAAEYYQASLEASREIINNGPYALYDSNPDPGENFWEMIVNKTGNSEMIMVEDFDASAGRAHLYTRDLIPRSLVQDASAIIGGSAVSPTLQLAEASDYLDGSSGELRGVSDGTDASQDDWIFYDRPEDIFEGKDGRLYGTIIYPGTDFAGNAISMQAGVYVWNDTELNYDRVVGAPGSRYDDDGVLTGNDGPIAIEDYVSATGFLVRKFLDPDPSARQSAVDSEVWWVKFRLGEIYLNAAEAAFELGETGEALGYINTLRERAGFPPGTLTTLDRQTIRDERRTELAFEDHRVWDLRRWRIAHVLWDGLDGSMTSNAWSLFGYRIVRPGHPDHNKYVYDKIPAIRQLFPRFFRMGNYYSAIPNNVVNSNPSIVRNPFH